MKQALVSFCIVILLVVVSGCSNVNSPVTVDGSITGVVSLGNEIGSSSPNPFTSSAGVSVSLDGTSLSTVTDSSGFWKFDNIPSGNYDVTITKSGFGLTRIYGVTVGGPGTAFIPRVALGELPSEAPTLVSANVVTVVWSDTGKQHQRQDLEIRWKTPYDRSYCGLTIFMDKDGSVQPADLHFYSTLNGNGLQEWLGWYNGMVADSLPHSNPHDGLISCPVETLHARGITSGAKIYISLAQWDPYPINGEAPNTKVTYYDPIHNQNRLISPSPRSNVVELTMP
jgi:carboxypeptidase family protein